MDVAHAHRRGVHVRAFLRADGALGESVPADDAVFCELHSRRTVAAPVHRGLSLSVSAGDGNSIRSLGAWRCTRPAWRMGPLLYGIHGRVPPDARRSNDLPVSRRGPGPGEPGNDGAVAGARVNSRVRSAPTIGRLCAPANTVLETESSLPIEVSGPPALRNE